MRCVARRRRHTYFLSTWNIYEAKEESLQLLSKGKFPSARIQMAYDALGKEAIRIGVERLRTSEWEKTCNNRGKEKGHK